MEDLQGQVLAALVWLLAWKRKCQVTACGVLVEVAALVAGVVLPVLGWIFLIPALLPCKDLLVVQIVDSAGAVMVLAGLSCAAAIPQETGPPS